MKLPSIPKMPKVPKINPAELREKLPFQPRREFVMRDSEHPVDSADMNYRPSTGYVPSQAPAPPVPPPAPANYGNVDHQLPFRQEMAYPGGQVRTPYAAGGQARQEYTGSWPPPPAYPQRGEPTPRPQYAQPEHSTVDPMFAQAEYYVPRANYRPAPEFAQPRVYPQQPPRQPYMPPQGYYPQHGPTSRVPAQETARPRPKKDKPGFAVMAAGLLASLMPRKKPKAPTGQSAAHRQPAAQQSATQPPRAMSAGEMKYFIWAGSIAAGLLLTVISFIYACAA